MIHACTKHSVPCASCYANHGCRCDGCLTDRGWKIKRRRHLTAIGHMDRVPVEPVTRHVQRLRRTMSVMQIAALAGTPHDAVRRAEHATNPTITLRLAAALLAVHPVRIENQTIGRVDGIGTRRRMQALIALGWSAKALAAEIGVAIPIAHRWLNADVIYATTRATVAALYDRLWDEPPPEVDRYQKQSANRSRNHAARRGWVLPLCWDDDTIDDPAAKPHRSRPAPTPRGTTDSEVLHLIGTDSADGIARRLGFVDLDSLATTIGRKDKHLAERLRRAKEVA